MKKEEKATQTVSRKVWRKRKRKLSDLQQIRVRKSIKMPAKPPKMPKNPTQEQLDDYSKTLEQYFKEKERELAEQQLESDRTLEELNKEKTNVELRERNFRATREECSPSSRIGKEYG